MAAELEGGVTSDRVRVRTKDVGRAAAARTMSDSDRYSRAVSYPPPSPSILGRRARLAGSRFLFFEELVCSTIPLLQGPCSVSMASSCE